MDDQTIPTVHIKLLVPGVQVYILRNGKSVKLYILTGELLFYL